MFRHIFIKCRDAFLKNLFFIEHRHDNVSEWPGTRRKGRLALGGGEVPRLSQWLGYGCCFHSHAGNYIEEVCNFALNIYRDLFQYQIYSLDIKSNTSNQSVRSPFYYKLNNQDNSKSKYKKLHKSSTNCSENTQSAYILLYLPPPLLI